MTSKAIFIFVNMYSSQNNVWKSKKEYTNSNIFTIRSQSEYKEK